ncbi:MAG: ATP-binding cassette domain-containing protein [Patescibacteria group bacterium]
MLTTKNITKYNQEKTTVLESVDIEVKPGTITSLIGPSGAGKTTLLNVMAFSAFPDKGEITIDDKKFSFPINGELTPHASSSVAMVFQQLFLWPHLTLRENITISNKSSESEVRELISAFGMEGFIDRYPNQTSLGQRQRAALARAIALKPRYLLLDEVTSALDIEQIESVVKYLEKLRSNGTGIVAVTHLLHFAKRISDQIVFMDKGRIIEIGGKEVLSDPKEARTKEFLAFF